MKSNKYQFKVNKVVYNISGYSVQNAWQNLMQKEAFNLSSENHILVQKDGTYIMSFNNIEVTKL